MAVSTQLQAPPQQAKALVPRLRMKDKRDIKNSRKLIEKYHFQKFKAESEVPFPDYKNPSEAHAAIAMIKTDDAASFEKFKAINHELAAHASAKTDQIGKIKRALSWTWVALVAITVPLGMTVSIPLILTAAALVATSMAKRARESHERLITKFRDAANAAESEPERRIAEAKRAEAAENLGAMALKKQQAENIMMRTVWPARK